MAFCFSLMVETPVVFPSFGGSRVVLCVLLGFSEEPTKTWKIPWAKWRQESQRSQGSGLLGVSWQSTNPSCKSKFKDLIEACWSKNRLESYQDLFIFLLFQSKAQDQSEKVAATTTHSSRASFQQSIFRKRFHQPRRWHLQIHRSAMS